MYVNRRVIAMNRTRDVCVKVSRSKYYESHR